MDVCPWCSPVVNSLQKLSGQLGGINDENLELFLEWVIDVSNRR